ncbi:hypothetical protein M426DRAFT_319829 [Hypoxylon sp. CI-4A]|nr:hypothetical protein M426DRAFT_319829 [Hypoxylon sp. CI-4A]
MSSYYHYQPMKEDGHIRMLSLDPGKPGGPLRGKLETVSIDSVGKYEAVSYVWADPGPPDCDWEIHLHDNGIDHLLKLKTGSIYAALHRLRLATRERRVWVDQICINQDNLEERSRQVRFMNEIFRNAEHVLVWLGLDEKDEAGLAFASIHRLYERLVGKAVDLKSNPGFIQDLEEQLEGCQKSLHDLTNRKWVSATIKPRAFMIQYAKQGYHSSREGG